MKSIYSSRSLSFLLLSAALATVSCFSEAATGNIYGPPSTNQAPPLRSPATPVHEKQHVPLPPMPHKPVVQPMAKPFGMPGVIGVVNNKWEGTDYLGYLTDKIGIDIEILKAAEVPPISDSSAIEQKVAEIFAKHSITPRADDGEGLPLPFLHLLIIIYPVDQDKYVIFGNARLFEEIKVVRKEFVPQGYWQGITWENQDVSLSNGAQLDDKVKQIALKLGEAFVKRYRQYNLETGAVPSNPEAPPQPA